MVEEERRQDWEGAGGLMFNLPYYGLDKEAKLAKVCREHLRMCKLCQRQWSEKWELIPETHRIEELAQLIQGNHA